MLKIKIESIKPDWLIKLYRNKILRNRIISLFVTGYIGVLVMVALVEGSDVFGSLEENLILLALGLPTFFILWLFRTRDVHENINNNTFFECARMLTEKYQDVDTLSTLPQTVALGQLAYLKRETGFNRKRIDRMTQGLNLKNLDLSYTDLGGLDLSRATLMLAKLNNTDLSNVNLTDADLKGAKLNNINFDKDTIWKGAIYNDKTEFGGTKFKDESERIAVGMIYKPDRQA